MSVVLVHLKEDTKDEILDELLCAYSGYRNTPEDDKKIEEYLDDFESYLKIFTHGLRDHTPSLGIILSKHPHFSKMDVGFHMSNPWAGSVSYFLRDVTSKPMMDKLDVYVDHSEAGYEATKVVKIIHPIHLSIYTPPCASAFAGEQIFRRDVILRGIPENPVVEQVTLKFGEYYPNYKDVLETLDDVLSLSNSLRIIIITGSDIANSEGKIREFGEKHCFTFSSLFPPVNVGFAYSVYPGEGEKTITLTRM